jgi:hypothetical protein
LNSAWSPNITGVQILQELHNSLPEKKEKLRLKPTNLLFYLSEEHGGIETSNQPHSPGVSCWLHCKASGVPRWEGGCERGCIHRHAFTTLSPRSLCALSETWRKTKRGSACVWSIISNEALWQILNYKLLLFKCSRTDFACFTKLFEIHFLSRFEARANCQETRINK